MKKGINVLDIDDRDDFDFLWGFFFFLYPSQGAGIQKRAPHKHEKAVNSNGKGDRIYTGRKSTQVDKKPTKQENMIYRRFEPQTTR